MCRMSGCIWNKFCLLEIAVVLNHRYVNAHSSGKFKTLNTCNRGDNIMCRNKFDQ